MFMLDWCLRQRSPRVLIFTSNLHIIERSQNIWIHTVHTHETLRFISGIANGQTFEYCFFSVSLVMYTLVH